MTAAAEHLIANAKRDSLEIHGDESWEHVAAILAERAVKLAQAISPGYVRAGLPPVEPNVLREAGE